MNSFLLLSITLYYISFLKIERTASKLKNKIKSGKQ